MAIDTLIRGALLVDGTGAAPRAADVAIEGERIARVADAGTIDAADPAEVVEAEGLILTPGFIDPHTHYDAQLFWDPYATPSSLHGVTTVIGGNCGFTIAPVAPDDDVDYLRRMLAKVENFQNGFKRIWNKSDWKRRPLPVSRNCKILTLI